MSTATQLPTARGTARIRELLPELQGGEVGRRMHELITRLYPICRSLTGDGVRETLAILGERIDLEVQEVPTGTPVFDWQIPKEWNIRDAWIANERGERVVDFGESNLHVVGYSVPTEATLSLEELRPHLHTLPDRPERIPYRTSYYGETWGFCLAHRDLERLEEGAYDVRIEASLEPGHLTYGEAFLPGETEEEILVHTHICHPSMCNDNLSGIAVATFLAEALAGARRRHSFRFLFLPGTIGAIAWLARNEARIPRIKGGLVLSNLGDAAGFTYKRSRRGEALIDRAAAHVLAHRPGEHAVEDFVPYGYDERQYCSPGIDLPVGALCRSRWGTYPEYHTSADDLDFVRPDSLAGSLAVCMEILEVVEENATFRNLSPKGEPHLGRRGLYDDVGGGEAPPDRMALLWVLNQSDGRHDLLDIAERSGMALRTLRRAAEALESVGLLERGGAGASR